LAQAVLDERGAAIKAGAGRHTITESTAASHIAGQLDTEVTYAS
jgi:hypothetical protein